MRKVFILFFTICAACAPVSRPDFLSEYQNGVRQLGLIPLYPPREDIQVGDVYAVSRPKTESGGDLDADPDDVVRTQIGTDHAVVGLVERYLSDRVVFQSTARHASNTTEPDQPDTFGTGFQTRGNLIIESLPIHAFPEITADVGASGGFGIINALTALGLAGGARTQLKLSFNDVRKFGAPKNFVAEQAIRTGVRHYDLFLDQNKDPVNWAVTDQVLKQDLARFIRSRKARNKGNTGNIVTDPTLRCTRVVVVTAVYLTRQITYTYSNARIIAAALKRAESGAGPATGGTVNSPTSVIVNVNSGTDAEPVPGFSDSDIAGVATALNTSISGDTQGSAVRFEAWDALGMRFTQEFERPVAVAYEGFVFTKDPKGCNLNPE